jgi:hypothetical protein
MSEGLKFGQYGHLNPFSVQSSSQGAPTQPSPSISRFANGSSASSSSSCWGASRKRTGVVLSLAATLVVVFAFTLDMESLRKWHRTVVGVHAAAGSKLRPDPDESGEELDPMSKVLFDAGHSGSARIPRHVHRHKAMCPIPILVRKIVPIWSEAPLMSRCTN